NVAATLGRFAGNRTALNGTLDRFPGAARSVHLALLSTHASGDRESVLRHLHTLYGLAGIAGAEQLAALAHHRTDPTAATDTPIEEEIPLARLTEIGHALDAVNAEIARVRPAPAAMPAAAVRRDAPARAVGPLPAELQASLSSLRELLATSSLGALDAFTALRGMLDHHDAPAATAIDDALATLAFAPAMEHVDSLLQEDRP
ncbi:MAG: hypothetical protein ABIO84_07275, partial [Lysobacter sp.]